MCKNKYSVKKVKKNDLISLYKVCRILYLCGRDMASKYSLHHWDNSYLKNWLIVLLCNLKNSIYPCLWERWDSSCNISDK